MTAKNKIADGFAGAGQFLVNSGRKVQGIASVLRPSVAPYRPSKDALDPADPAVLSLLEGDDFIEFFARRMKVGTWGIVKFYSPIRRTKDGSFSLATTQMAIRVIEVPMGQKVPLVRVDPSILTPKAAYPAEGAWLQLTEMDFYLQPSGHFAFVPTEGFSFAQPVTDQVSATKMW